MSMEPTYGLQETKKHGSLLFPCNIYPCSIPRDFPAVMLHWHTSMELIFVKKGSGQVQVGEQIMTAAAGDLFVIPPGTLHALRELAGYSMEYENIIFDVEFLGTGTADSCAQKYLVPLTAGQLGLPVQISLPHPAYNTVVKPLIRMEELCRDRGFGFELGVKACLLSLLFELLQLPSNSSVRESADTERLKMLLQKIEDEYSHRLTVAQAAACCGYSSSHFMRWFKQATGTSFCTYLNDRRLAAAAERLRETSDTVLAIAEEVGFDNLSHFNHQFKKRYHVTPREYRLGMTDTH